MQYVFDEHETATNDEDVALDVTEGVWMILHDPVHSSAKGWLGAKPLFTFCAPTAMQ
jgi:hypothetical protein